MHEPNDDGSRVIVVSISTAAPLLTESGTLLKVLFEGQGGDVTLSGVVVSDANGGAIAADWRDGAIALY